MKKKSTLLLLLFIIISTACKKESLNKEFVIKIKDSKVNCSGYEGQKDCYLVQQGDLIGTDEWEYFYENIEGFNYAPGFIYEIQVKKQYIENPPIDLPDVKYFFIKELSKKKVN